LGPRSTRPRLRFVSAVAEFTGSLAAATGEGSFGGKGSTRVTIPEIYRGPLWSAVVLSGTILVLSALVVDFGETLRVNLVALLLFWGWIVVALYRRPEKPTAIDLWLVRWGILPFVICFLVVVQTVWRWRGRL
jgi:hypothetical protein